MKLILKYFIFIVAIIVVASSHLKTSQMNYRDQYETCLNDYQKMYKMMNDKLKFYADNENALLESVKSTILKTYEKSDKLVVNYKKRIMELEEELKNSQSQTKSKEDEIDQQKEDYDNKITDLNNKICLIQNQNEQLSQTQKVLQEDLKNAKKENVEIKEQIKESKHLVSKQESEFQMKLTLMSQKMKELTDESILADNTATSGNDDANEAENNLAQSKADTSSNLKNQIAKSEKLKSNLDLITNQIKKIDNDTKSDDAVDPSASDSDNFDARKKLSKRLNTTMTVKNNKTSNKKSNKTTNFTSNKTNNKPNNKTKNKTNNKEFMFFDKKKVNRFLETEDKLNDKNNIHNQIEFLSNQEKDLKTKLDLVLFEDINISRQIFQKIQDFGNLHSSVVNSKELCEAKVKKITKDNFELKEALAELETLYRLSKTKQ